MIIQGVCLSYKLELFQGIHLPTHDYKIALFTSNATLNKTTTTYIGQTDEVAGMNYIAGGKILTGYSPTLINDTAVLDFDDVVWANATITARGCLIYNSSLVGKNTVAVFNFNQDFSSVNNSFVITLPPVGESTALIRII